jgi:hypothetical protein
LNAKCKINVKGAKINQKRCGKGENIIFGGGGVRENMLFGLIPALTREI